MFIEVVERIYEMHVGSQFRVQPFIPVKNTTILYEPLKTQQYYMSPYSAASDLSRKY